MRLKNGYSIKIKISNKGQRSWAILLDSKGSELLATGVDAEPEYAIKGLLESILGRDNTVIKKKAK